MNTDRNNTANSKGAANSGAEKKRKWITFMVITVVVFAFGFLGWNFFSSTSSESQYSSEPQFVRAVRKSKLNLYRKQYSNFIDVGTEEDPDDIQYSLQYSAVVKAGIDLGQIEFIRDDEAKTYTILLPEIEIEEPELNDSEFDWIFVNRKLNQIAVYADSNKIVSDKVRERSLEDTELRESTKKRAENFIRSTMETFQTEEDKDYEIIVDFKEQA